MTSIVVGMVWYRREDYPSALRIMVDSKSTMFARFDEWEKAAKRGESHRKANGEIVVRAIIDPETFPTWCATRGLSADAKARNAFAAEIARRKQSSQ